MDMQTLLQNPQVCLSRLRTDHESAVSGTLPATSRVLPNRERNAKTGAMPSLYDQERTQWR